MEPNIELDRSFRDKEARKKGSRRNDQKESKRDREQNLQVYRIYKYGYIATCVCVCKRERERFLLFYL